MIDRDVHLTLSVEEAEWLKMVVEDAAEGSPWHSVLDKVQVAMANHARRRTVLSDEDVLDTLLAEVQRNALGRVRRTTPAGRIAHFEAPFFEVAARLHGLKIPAKSPGTHVVPHNENSLRLRLQRALSRVGWTCAAMVPTRAKYGLVQSTMFTFHRDEDG